MEIKMGYLSTVSSASGNTKLSNSTSFSTLITESLSMEMFDKVTCYAVVRADPIDSLEQFFFNLKIYFL
jgi:hypothetical protein